MARKSRKQINRIDFKVESPSYKSLVGIYVRLSAENNGYKTKDSIQNQVAFLKEFIEENKNEFELIQIYIDNGITGVHFERQGWNLLINDIKIGKINCIVVKDLSRIGRNYIEVGDYLERIFPCLGIRVIAINDNFDSSRQSFCDNMIIPSLINIVNEYYSRDISQKVTKVKKVMQKKGEYIGSILPYGYKRSDKDRKKLIPDPKCADIVKKIFEWYIQKQSCTSIAQFLNYLSIPSPNSTPEKNKNTGWKAKHITKILTNPIYFGHMIQGKTRCSYFEQNRKLRFLPKEDWIIVKNTHTPLVTQKQFELVYEKLQNNQERKKEIGRKISCKISPNIQGGWGYKRRKQ